MKGVVFDFDGVIADTMPQHAQAYRQVLAPLGISFDDEEIFALEGARSESIIAQLGAPDNAAALANDKQEAFARLGEPQLYPGANELVKTVQHSTRTAVVTGTRRENLERMIPELLSRFDAVLSQEAYTHDKPHPEPYLKAAAALAIDPKHLVCVENATRGIRSALQAGYGHVIAIATTMPTATLQAAGAHQVATDHAQLRTMLLERVGADAS